MNASRCIPDNAAEWWSHHWIGPMGGDSEPWIWKDTGGWCRAGEIVTPEQMDARGWVYVGPCERPEVVADLRTRLAAAEARHGAVVVPIRTPKEPAP